MSRLRSSATKAARSVRKGAARRTAAVRWIAANPGEAWREREWLLQQLGLGRIRSSERFAGGQLRRVNPEFLTAFGVPLTDPSAVPAEEASYMQAEDLVLGLQIGDVARAFPWWIMDNHHVANDVVGGRPVMLMFCEMCGSGIGFDPVVSGRRLTFRLSHIFNGLPAMTDDQTGSVWSPYFGMAIRGKLVGQKLGFLPLLLMSWEEWRRMHPTTTVLPAESGSRGGHGSQHSMVTDWVPSRFRQTMARWDTRLPHGTAVLGVIGDAWQRAYPIEDLRAAGGVLNDDPGDGPIVVLCNPDTAGFAAAAYSRNVDGRTLTFEPSPGGGAVDLETGSRWSIEGESLAGPLSGRSLTFVPSHVAKWFIWAAHFPQIEIVSEDAASGHT